MEEDDLVGACKSVSFHEQDTSHQACETEAAATVTTTVTATVTATVTPLPPAVAVAADQSSIIMEEDNPKSSRKRWDLKRPQSSKLTSTGALRSNAAPTSTAQSATLTSNSNSSFLKQPFTPERNENWASSPALSNYSRHQNSRLDPHQHQQHQHLGTANAPWNHSTTKKSSSDPSFLSEKRPFHVTNSTFSLIQRSDKGKVKDALAKIQIACNVYSELELKSPPTTTHHTPDTTSLILAMDNVSSLLQYAQDDYYRIVIVNNDGIAIILHAMTTFLEFAELQASACAALLSLCQKSERSQRLLLTSTSTEQRECGGLHCIVQVLERHINISFLTNLALEVLNVATSLNPVVDIQHLRTMSMSDGTSFELFLQNFPERLLLPEAINSLQILRLKFSMGHGGEG